MTQAKVGKGAPAHVPGELAFHPIMFLYLRMKHDKSLKDFVDYFAGVYQHPAIRIVEEQYSKWERGKEAPHIPKFALVVHAWNKIDPSVDANLFFSVSEAEAKAKMGDWGDRVYAQALKGGNFVDIDKRRRAPKKYVPSA